MTRSFLATEKIQIPMVPLRPEGRVHALELLSDQDSPELLALRHALLYARPALWGDDAWRPRCIVLVRSEVGGRAVQAFGGGEPEPAVGWLMARTRRTGATLVAPLAWAPWVEAELGSSMLEFAETETWHDLGPPPRAPSSSPTITVERLTDLDELAFRRAAPDWALHAWGDYQALLRHGACLGVPHQGGFAALAWVFDQTEQFDAVGLFTIPRFRRLGLGHASAMRLLDHIRKVRNKQPLWSTPAGHDVSSHLAQILGFTQSTSQRLLRWPGTGTHPG